MGDDGDGEPDAGGQAGEGGLVIGEETEQAGIGFADSGHQFSAK